MHASLIALFLLLAPIARAEEGYRYETVRCGVDTIVIFEGTQSPDGHYALGWTIRPVAKDAKPVDWSGLDKKGPLFPDDYPYENEETGKAPYYIVNGIIDLRDQSFRDLPVSEGFYTNSTHGWRIGAKWLDTTHAVVTVDARFWTNNLFFVQTNEKERLALDMISTSNQLVEKIIERKRPLAGEMEVMYNGEEIAVRDEVIRLPFSAWQLKGSYEDLEGQLLISSKDGKILKAINDDSADQPFTGELGQADKQLNQVYGKLRKALVDEDLKHLVIDQKKWITTRNSEACEFAKEKVPFFNEGSTLEAYRVARNRQALKLTRERTASLQQQLDAASSNNFHK